MRVRDQYGAEHDINESQLAYEPWRSCEVVAENDEPDPAAAPKPQPAPSQPDDMKPTSKKAAFRPASEDKE